MKKQFPTPPSEIFERLVCDAGTPRSTCGFCGREHIATEGHLDEGELHFFRERARRSENPKLFLEHDCHAVGIGEINGVRWVEGCECNALGQYEAFIWNNRALIIHFIKERLAKDMATAAETTEALKSL